MNIKIYGKALLMAETHLGRGWLAFLLYDFYGPIPIPTLEDLKNPLDEVIEPRATQEEMTNFIETELTESLKGLPTRTTQFGRFDKGLAYTILMKYYMHEKNWAKAEECGRELLKAEYGYGLMDRYADIFTLENEGNKEIIFACTEERGTNLQLWHDHALSGKLCISFQGRILYLPVFCKEHQIIMCRLLNSPFLLNYYFIKKSHILHAADTTFTTTILCLEGGTPAFSLTYNRALSWL